MVMYKYYIYKIISVIVAIIFFCQTTVLAGPAIIPQVAATTPEKSFKIYIPESYGKIAKDSGYTAATSEKTVVIIKDAHCNYEAQTNISHILDILIRDYKIDLVCVEGATGSVDPSKIASHCEDTDIRNKVTDKYLRKGLLTASEALSINRGAEPGFSIWGVESLKLYFKDYQAFRETIGTNNETRHFVNLLRETITKLKKKLYPSKLQKFDIEINRYEINEIPLTNFIKFLTLIKPVQPEKYPTLDLVLESIRLEEKVYFGKVEDERTELISHLEKQLTKDDLRELIKQSLLFKLGKISQVDYYTYLEGFHRAFRETITFPTDNLQRYFKLVKLQAKIDEKGLFSELDKFQENIYNDLIPDETAHKLHELDKELKILAKILNLESTREDFLYYKSNRSKFTPAKLVSLLKIQAPLHNIRLPLEFNDPVFMHKVETAFLPSEEFYDFALDRDRALVQNLLKAMEDQKKDSAVLVVGGFHTDGIKKLLSENGIIPIIITPSISKAQGNSHELYLARMMDKRIEPEMILAKLGLENLQAVLSASDIGYRYGLPEPIISELEQLLTQIALETTGFDLELLAEQYEDALETNPVYAAFLRELIRTLDTEKKVFPKLSDLPTKVKEKDIVTEVLVEDLIKKLKQAKTQKQAKPHIDELEKAAKGDNEYAARLAIISIETFILSPNTPEDIKSLLITALKNIIDSTEGNINKLAASVRERILKAPFVTESTKQALAILDTHTKRRLTTLPNTTFTFQMPTNIAQNKLPAAVEAARVFSALINQKGKEFVEKAVSNIYGREFSLDNIQEIIFQYHDSGSQKDVYRITFKTREGVEEQIAFAAAYKEAIERFEEGELDNLQKLKDSGLVPKFGEAIEYQGHQVFIEEWIEGPTAFDLLKSRKLSTGFRKEIVKVIMSIYKELGGKSPKDLNLKNFIYDTINRRIVLIDIGLIQAQPPSSLLSDILADYGPLPPMTFNERGETVNMVYLDEDYEGVSYEYVFDAIFEILGSDKGRIFLAESLRDTTGAISEVIKNKIRSYLFDRKEEPRVPDTPSPGHKAHKQGTPHVVGQEAENSHVDYIIKNLFFKQGNIRGGYRAQDAPIVKNNETGTEIEFDPQDEENFSEALTLIDERLNEIAEAILNAEGLFRNELKVVNDELSLLEIAIREAATDEEKTFKKAEKYKLEQHKKLLEKFFPDKEIKLFRPRMFRKWRIKSALRQRLKSFYTLIIPNTNFLVFNNAENYWAGHSSTSKNAVYIPEGLYNKIKDSPHALSAFLMDEVIDGVLGKHSSLSERLIDICNEGTEIKLKTTVLELAEKTEGNLAELILAAYGKIQAGNIIQAINLLRNALNPKIEEGIKISPTELPTVLTTLLGSINASYLSTFTFMISGTPELRDILNAMIEKPMYYRQNQGYLWLDIILNYIRKPVAPIPITWIDVITKKLKEALDPENQEIRNQLISDVIKTIEEQIDGTQDPEEIIRYLSIIFIEYDFQNLDDPSKEIIKQFIYNLLASEKVKGLYAPTSYMSLVIETINKLEDFTKEQILEALNRYVQPEVDYGTTFAILLVLLDQLQLGNESGKQMIREFINKPSPGKKIDIESISLDVTGPFSEKLKEAGFKNLVKLKEEIADLINEEDLIASVDNTLDKGNIEHIIVKSLAYSAHTLVFLMTIEMKDGSSRKIVLKKGFYTFYYSIISNVYNTYLKFLKGEKSKKHTPSTLVHQHGEWLTPYSRDGRLLGYWRAEEFVEGVTLGNIKEAKRRNEINEETYKIAEIIAVAKYYILFKYVFNQRWFIGDATGANVMFTADGEKIDIKVVDIEARFELAEGVEDEHFQAFMENRGFSLSNIIQGTTLAEMYVREGITGGFDFDFLSEHLDISLGKAKEAIMALRKIIKPEAAAEPDFDLPLLAPEEPVTYQITKLLRSNKDEVDRISKDTGISQNSIKYFFNRLNSVNSRKEIFKEVLKYPIAHYSLVISKAPNPTLSRLLIINEDKKTITIHKNLISTNEKVVSTILELLFMFYHWYSIALTENMAVDQPIRQLAFITLLVQLKDTNRERLFSALQNIGVIKNDVYDFLHKAHSAALSGTDALDKFYRNILEKIKFTEKEQKAVHKRYLKEDKLTPALIDDFVNGIRNYSYLQQLKDRIAAEIPTESIAKSHLDLIEAILNLSQLKDADDTDIEQAFKILYSMASTAVMHEDVLIGLRDELIWWIKNANDKHKRLAISTAFSFGILERRKVLPAATKTRKGDIQKPIIAAIKAAGIVRYRQMINELYAMFTNPDIQKPQKDAPEIQDPEERNIYLENVYTHEDEVLAFRRRTKSLPGLKSWLEQYYTKALPEYKIVGVYVYGSALYPLGSSKGTDIDLCIVVDYKDPSQREKLLSPKELQEEIMRLWSKKLASHPLSPEDIASIYAPGAFRGADKIDVTIHHAQEFLSPDSKDPHGEFWTSYVQRFFSAFPVYIDPELEGKDPFSKVPQTTNILAKSTTNTLPRGLQMFAESNTLGDKRKGYSKLLKRFVEGSAFLISAGVLDAKDRNNIRKFYGLGEKYLEPETELDAKAEKEFARAFSAISSNLLLKAKENLKAIIESGEISEDSGRIFAYLINDLIKQINYTFNIAPDDNTPIDELPEIEGIVTKYIRESSEITQRKAGARQAIIPNLQKQFGKFGNTDWYKLLAGPVFEEFGLLLGYPLVLLFRMTNIISKDNFREINNNLYNILKYTMIVGFRGIPLFTAVVLSSIAFTEIAAIGFILAVIVTGYFFIFAHPADKSLAAEIVTIFSFFILGGFLFIMPLAGLIIPMFITIAFSIALSVDLHVLINIFGSKFGAPIALIGYPQAQPSAPPAQVPLKTLQGLSPGLKRLYNQLTAFIETKIPPAIAAISDIHGNLQRLNEILNEVGAHVDKFVFLGDYMDRGPDGLKVMAKVIELKNRGRAIPLMGNHDLMFIMAMMGDWMSFVNWLGNGGLNVLEEGGFEDQGSTVRDIILELKQYASQVLYRPGTKEEISFLEKVGFFAHSNEAKFKQLTDAIRGNIQLQELASWMREHLNLYHIGENGALYVHAGIPIDNDGNLVLIHESNGVVYRGTEALAMLEEDMQKAFKEGNAEADILRFLTSNKQSPLYIRKTRDGRDLHEVMEEVGAENILKHLGVAMLVVGHTQVDDVLNIDNAIYAIDTDMRHGKGTVLWNDDDGLQYKSGNDPLMLPLADDSFLEVIERGKKHAHRLLSDLERKTVMPTQVIPLRKTQRPRPAPRISRRPVTRPVAVGMHAAHMEALALPADSDNYAPQGELWRDDTMGGKAEEVLSEIEKTVNDNKALINQQSTTYQIWKGKTEDKDGQECEPIIDSILSERMSLSGEEFLAILSRALAQAEKFPDAKLENLKRKLTISYLKKSSHIIEDHIANGFIGINEAAIQAYNKIKAIYDEQTANNFLQWILEHELIHELTGEGTSIETDIQKRDANRFVELFSNKQNILTFLSNTGIEVDKQFEYECLSPNTEKLKYIGKAKIGGEKYKEFWVDENNNLWIFKVNPYEQEPYRPQATETYHKFKKKYFDTQVASYDVTLRERQGTLEKIIFEGDISEIQWGNLSEQEANELFTEHATPNFKKTLKGKTTAILDLSEDQNKQILQEMVIDWLFSNHDAHPANFIIDNSGNLIGIDKEQCFKFFPDDKLDLGYTPNGKAYTPLSYLVIANLAIRGRLSFDLIEDIIQKIESIPNGELITLITPLAEAYSKSHPDKFPTPESFIKAFLERKDNLRTQFEEFFKNINSLLQSNNINYTFTKPENPYFLPSKFDPNVFIKPGPITYKHHNFSNLIKPGTLLAQSLTSLVNIDIVNTSKPTEQPQSSPTDPVFNTQTEMNQQLASLYGLEPELLQRIIDAGKNIEAVAEIIDRRIRELSKDAHPDTIRRLNAIKERLLLQLRSPPKETVKLQALLRLLTAWIAKVRQERNDYHRVYLSRDGGFFHFIDNALESQTGKVSDYDAGSSVYHLCRNRMSGENGQRIYNIMHNIVYNAREKTGTDINSLYKEIRKNFRERYESDKQFKKMVDAILEELKELGYDKMQKLIFVDTGFLGTIPFFLKNILEIEKTDYELADETGEENIQVAIIQPSSLKNFAKALFGFDLNMFSEGERSLLETLAAQFGEGKDIGAHLEAIKFHPIRFNTTRWMIEETDAESQLEVFGEQIIAAQMVGAHIANETGIENLPPEVGEMLSSLMLKRDFSALIKNDDKFDFVNWEKLDLFHTGFTITPKDFEPIDFSSKNIDLSRRIRELIDSMKIKPKISNVNVQLYNADKIKLNLPWYWRAAMFLSSIVFRVSFKILQAIDKLFIDLQEDLSDAPWFYKIIFSRFYRKYLPEPLKSFVFSRLLSIDMYIVQKLTKPKKLGKPRKPDKPEDRAHMEALRIPERYRDEHYAEENKINGETYDVTDVKTTIRDAEENRKMEMIEKDLPEGFEYVTTKTSVTVNGETFDVHKFTYADRDWYISSKLLDSKYLTLEQFLSQLSKALAANDIETDKLPKELFIMHLSHSPHLFEDHVGNGFIGINQSLLKIIKEADNQTLENKEFLLSLLELGLEHELFHEFRVQGIEIEKELFIRDARRFVEVFEDTAGEFLKFLLGQDILDEDSDFVRELWRKITRGPLFEVNARASGKKFTEITEHDLRTISENGYKTLWMMGIWQISPASTRLNESYGPGHVGSAYAIMDYKINPELGTEEEFMEMVDRANKVGLKVMIDFIPNHMAMDSPWIDNHPDWFVQPEAEESNIPAHYLEGEKSRFYRHKSNRIISHGAEGWDSPAWRDTAQLDYTNPELRRHMIETLKYIAAITRGGGARCDMSMLVMNEQFRDTWHNNRNLGDFNWEKRGKKERQLPEQEFWVETINELKRTHPEFIFLAEAYWGKEGPLQQMGMDVTYDKHISDTLARGDIPELKRYLNDPKVLDGYLERTAHLLSDHAMVDELLRVMDIPRRKATALFTYTITGNPLVYQHEAEGANLFASADWLPERGEVTHDSETKGFYGWLLSVIKEPIFRLGSFKLLSIEGRGAENVIAHARKHAGEKAVVIINYSNNDADIKVDLDIGADHEKQEYLFTDLITGEEKLVTRDQVRQYVVELSPWGYTAFTLFHIEDVAPQKVERLRREQGAAAEERVSIDNKVTSGVTNGISGVIVGRVVKIEEKEGRAIQSYKLGRLGDSPETLDSLAEQEKARFIEAIRHIKRRKKIVRDLIEQVLTEISETHMNFESILDKTIEGIIDQIKSKPVRSSADEANIILLEEIMVSVLGLSLSDEQIEQQIQYVKDAFSELFEKYENQIGTETDNKTKVDTMTVAEVTLIILDVVFTFLTGESHTGMMPTTGKSAIREYRMRPDYLVYYKKYQKEIKVPLKKLKADIEELKKEIAALKTKGVPTQEKEKELETKEYFLSKQRENESILMEILSHLHERIYIPKEREIESFKSALEKTFSETKDSFGKRGIPIPESVTQLMELLKEKVPIKITNLNFTANRAIFEVIEDIEKLSREETEFLDRLLEKLEEEKLDVQPYTGPPVVILQRKLFSSTEVTDLLKRYSGKVLAFICDEKGTATSHFSTIAKAYERIAVSGLSGFYDNTPDEAIIAVSGNTGKAVVNPDPDTLAAFRAEAYPEQIFEDYCRQPERAQSQANTATTSPEEISIPMTVMANVDNPQTADIANTAKEHGGAGIGLVRTEYLYDNDDSPSIQELIKIFSDLAEQSDNNPVTLRLFDNKPDKPARCLDPKRFDMDLLRLLAEDLYDPELDKTDPETLIGLKYYLRSNIGRYVFRTQLEAIIRTHQNHQNIRFMLPMVFPYKGDFEGNRAELEELFAEIEKVKAKLRTEGVENIDSIKIGFMVETVGSVRDIDFLLDHADFVSIGSNDLTQDEFGVDRNAPETEKDLNRYEKLQPKIIFYIARVLDAVRKKNTGLPEDRKKSVSICGDLGGKEIFAPLAIAISDLEAQLALSMPAVDIPRVKEIIRFLNSEKSRKLLEIIQSLGFDETEFKFTIDEATEDRMIEDINTGSEELVNKARAEIEARTDYKEFSHRQALRALVEQRETEPPVHMEALAIKEDSDNYAPEGELWRSNTVGGKVAEGSMDIIRDATRENKAEINEYSDEYSDWKDMTKDRDDIACDPVIDNMLTERMELSGEEFLAILSRALAQAEQYKGATLENLPRELIVSYLTKSSNIIENCTGDGFIGINEIALQAYTKIKTVFGKNTADNFLQWILEHELIHELTKQGIEIEEDLKKRDAERFVELFGAGSILIEKTLADLDIAIDKVFRRLVREELNDEDIENIEYLLQIEGTNLEGRALSTAHLEAMGELFKVGQENLVTTYAERWVTIDRKFTENPDWLKEELEAKIKAVGGVVRDRGDAAFFNRNSWTLEEQIIYSATRNRASRIELVSDGMGGGYLPMNYFIGKVYSADRLAKIRDAAQANGIRLGLHHMVMNKFGALDQDDIAREIQEIQNSGGTYLLFHVNGSEPEKIEELAQRAAQVAEANIQEGTKVIVNLENYPHPDIESPNAIREDNFASTVLAIRQRAAQILSKKYDTQQIEDALTIEVTLDLAHFEITTGDLLNNILQLVRSFSSKDESKQIRLSKIHAGNLLGRWADKQISSTFKSADTHLHIASEEGAIDMALITAVIGSLHKDRVLGKTGNILDQEDLPTVIIEQIPVATEEDRQAVDYTDKDFSFSEMAEKGKTIAETFRLVIGADELTKYFQLAFYEQIYGTDKAVSAFNNYYSTRQAGTDAAIKTIAQAEEAPHDPFTATRLALALNEIKEILSDYGIKLDREQEEKFTSILEKGAKGQLEEVNMTKIVEAIGKDKIPMESFLEITGRISKAVTKLVGENATEKGRNLVTGLLNEIMELIPEGKRVKAETETERFLKTIRNILTEIGVSASEIESDLELIEMGLHIITFDPLLDITEIDASYFDYIMQISALTGVSRQRIVDSFRDSYFVKQIELLTEGLDEEVRREIIRGIRSTETEIELSAPAQDALTRKVGMDRYKRIQAIVKMQQDDFLDADLVKPSDSKLLKAASRLKMYEDINNGDPDGKVDLAKLKTQYPQNENEVFNNSDFPSGKVTQENTVNLLSTIWAIQNDLRNAYGALQQIPGAEGILDIERTGIVSVPARNFAKLSRNESGNLVVEYNMPGILAFLRMGKNIMLNLQVSKEDDKSLWEELRQKGFPTDLQGRITISDEIETTEEAKTARDDLLETYRRLGVVVDRKNVAIIAGEKLKRQKIDNEFITQNDIKIFGLEKGTPLHAALLFGAFYALTEDAIVDGKLSDAVFQALMMLGVDSSTIKQIKEEGNLFFKVKLIRIEETLKQFQLRKMIVEIAA